MPARFWAATSGGPGRGCGDHRGLRAKRLDERIVHLYLDATMLEARWARTVEHVAALVAYGVGPDGHRRLLGVALGPSEAEASRWLPEARQQRCTVHLLRHVLTRTPQRLWACLAREVRPLFNAPSLAEAMEVPDSLDEHP